MTINVPSVPLTQMLDRDRFPAFLVLCIALLCVIAIMFSAPLHIQSVTEQLATIAEMAIPSSMILSGAHKVANSWQAVKEKQHDMPGMQPSNVAGAQAEKILFPQV